MKLLRTILLFSCITLLASSCESYEVWAIDIPTGNVSPEPPVVEPEPPVVEPEPPVVEPEPPVVEPEPGNCKFEFDAANLVVKICSGDDIEMLRSIMAANMYDLTIYFMQDINLADGQILKKDESSCMIKDWTPLPSIYHSKILTPNNKQIRITLTDGATKCALPQALFSEIGYSTFSNLWLDYNINSEGMDNSAAFLISSISNRFENITFSGSVVHHFITPDPDTVYMTVVGGIVASDFSRPDEPASQFIATVCQDATLDVHNMLVAGCVIGMANNTTISTWSKTNHVKSLKCKSEFSCSTGGLIGYFVRGNLTNSSNIVDEIIGDGWLGGLVGCSQYSTIENVNNQVNSISNHDTIPNNTIGGVTGYVLKSTIHNIQNNVNDMQIKGDSHLVGGIFGEIDYAADIENIVTRAKFTINKTNSKFAGFSSRIATYAPIRIANVSSIIETNQSTNTYHIFANNLKYEDFSFVEGVSFNPSIEFSNIACTGTLDIITPDNPNVIGNSKLDDDEITVSNFWYEVPDETFLKPNAGYPSLPHQDLNLLFSPYHLSTIDNALASLNANSTVEWKINSTNIDNVNTKILTFDATKDGLN